ncbi:STRN3, partial [Symbiodinium sp. CCMP2456]
KDKYEKKLKWFWADVGYEGTLTETDREKLTRETDIASGSKVAKVPLGLSRTQPLRPDAPAASGSEDDDEDDTDDETSEGESESDGAGSKPAKPTKGKDKKKRKREDDKDDDEAEEADMEAVPGLLEEILLIQSRVTKLLKRCDTLGVSKQASKLKQHNADLSEKHDELADFKAAHDSDEKVSELISNINKLLPGMTSRMTMEENKIKKCTLSQRSIESLGSKSSASAPVSHELATELAQAVVMEVDGAFGDDAVDMLQSAPLLQEMSRGYSTGHAASVTRKALQNMPEVQAPLPVTLVDVGLEQGHPCILYSDYFRTLADRGKLEILTTGADLQSFWDKMQPLKPDHPVYKLPAAERAFVIPIYLIGDEGRGFKHSAVFVLGSEPVLGNGCEAEDEHTAHEKLRMNFRGNTILTRQLFAVMPKKTYQKDSTPLRRLVNAWAEDLGKCFTNGLEVRSGESAQTWRIATIGLKADWPALSKLGCLTRHYLREAYPSGHGLCHLCMANTKQCPSWHEHDFDNASWVAGLATAVAPWKPSFYMIDLFHTFHKGIGADLAGSGLELFLHDNIILWLSS